MNLYNNRKGGFIKLILIILVIIVVLSLLKVDLRGFMASSPSVALKSNFGLIKEVLVTAWDYIVRAVLWVWNNTIAFVKGQTFQSLRQKVEENKALENSI